MEITIETKFGKEVVSFLEDHLKDMRSVSPPGSIHALDLDGLKKPDITFWTLWKDNTILGCGALKEINEEHGEIKAMRTAETSRGMGLASKMLQLIITEAEKIGYLRLSLETGSMDFFKPAHNLYEKYGFTPCGPFSNYVEDPFSVFMTKQLEKA